MIFRKVFNLLSVGGKLVYGDLIQCADNTQQTLERMIQINSMKENNLSDDEIIHWLEVLDEEDSPLLIEKIEGFLNESGFTSIEIKQMGMTAVFSAVKPLEILQVKAELLIQGIKDSEPIKEIFKRQNPSEIPKTGNNGVFLTLNGEQEVLISFLHAMNHNSPYSIIKKDGSLYLAKHNKCLDILINEQITPKWYYTVVDSQPFSSFFVLEGQQYLHLAYKYCAFNNDERCRFCSVKRRDNLIYDNQDKSAEAICAVLDKMLESNSIPTNYHFCLGGGTYLPISDNVDFFCKIISCIRRHRSKEKGENPIWIEMIPPSTDEIRRLVDVGATSFGFNIEVYDDILRHQFCPGKSGTASIENYFEAFETVKTHLGMNKVGSCIIAGLDNQANLKAGIDALIGYNVFPCVIPLKIFDGTNMNLSEDALSLLERDFIELSRYAAMQATTKGIDVAQNEGCMRCPCCTIVHDML